MVPNYLPVLLKVLPGCDCCELNGELVEDGATWISDGKSYECCRGEIVMKVESPVEPQIKGLTTIRGRVLFYWIKIFQDCSLLPVPLMENWLRRPLSTFLTWTSSAGSPTWTRWGGLTPPTSSPCVEDVTDSFVHQTIWQTTVKLLILSPGNGRQRISWILALLECFTINQAGPCLMEQSILLGAKRQTILQL